MRRMLQGSQHHLESGEQLHLVFFDGKQLALGISDLAFDLHLARLEVFARDGVIQVRIDEFLLFTLQRHQPRLLAAIGGAAPRDCIRIVARPVNIVVAEHRTTSQCASVTEAASMDSMAMGCSELIPYIRHEMRMLLLSQDRSYA